MTSAITLEQHVRVRKAFEAVLDSAIDPSRPGQLELFSDEEEQYLQHEVQRMLWEPLLASAGDQERQWLRWLRQLARDEELVVTLKAAAGRYAQALEKCLPMQEFIRKPGTPSGWLTLPGCYYSRKPVLATTNKSLHKAAMDLRTELGEAEDWSPRGRLLRWFADFILAGLPQPVSNFKMECLYLLRDGNGGVTRLVRLINTKGEMSEGREIGGADVLPNEKYGGSEKFREWVASRGNFTWGCEGGAGNVELQLLQKDVTEEAAYKVIRLIEYCGWYEVLPGRGQGKSAKAETEKACLDGLWVFDECAIGPNGQFILPDEDGIFWHDGEGYALSRKGRELDFTHGRPQMRPPTPEGGGLRVEQVQFDVDDWEPLARDMYLGDPGARETSNSHHQNPNRNQLGGFFREVCRRLYDTAGGYEGWVAMGAMLGYAAAPELFVKNGNFPSLWVSGSFGSGKSTFVAWLMSVCGFGAGGRAVSGMGLISSNTTAVGIACQLENYSNLPLWLDEYRENAIDKSKSPFLRDPYQRSLANKWSEDGVQRQIRTMPVVSGESTSSDGATRSRYPHVQISEQKRLAEHFEWMQGHYEFFFLIFRELLTRREEFVALTLAQVDVWLRHKDLERVENRVRVSHCVCYAALVAASRLLQSHLADEVDGFRRFLVQHALATASDVRTDKNVNVFVQDVVVAFMAGEIDPHYFRVSRRRVSHSPGCPNQPDWEECELFLEPHGVISQLQIYLRKQGQSVVLRYKDLRDQLSQDPSWIAGRPGVGLKKRFGRKVSENSLTAWGFRLDLHPLGYQAVTDEEFAAALLPEGEKRLDQIGVAFRDGDPRRGPLYGIVEGILKWESEEREK